MTILDDFKGITAFVFDMDGVLTNGSLYLFDNGEQVRQMNIKDGFALQLAIRKGYRVAVLSGSDSVASRDRLKRLGITEITTNVKDKRSTLLQYMADCGLSKKEVLFMGDDIPDYGAMIEAGLACAPADAVAEIKKVAAYICNSGGGMGCVREVIENTLKLNGNWDISTDTSSL